ncbi:MAG: type IV toxin-antitoxin system AbiEi family antitoxin domain-containing protein [Solirubrobacteraceae bacterium]
MHEVERAIAGLAAGQDDLVSRAQLMAAGIGRGAIDHRIRSGRLQRIHHGVFLIGYAGPTQRQLIRAAGMAVGDDALVSHRAAAILWQLRHGELPAVDVTVPGRRPRRQAGIAIHRTRVLEAVDVVVLDGIRVTSAARTICDLAVSQPAAEVQAALTEALVRRRLTGAGLYEMIRRLGPRRGSARLRALMAAELEHGYTRSEAERRLRGLLKSSGLPMPQFGVLVNGHLVDCVWHRERLILEVDGFATHGSRAAFEADRRRDQDHLAALYRVVRVSWRQLTQEPAGVLVRIAQALVAPVVLVP